MLAVHKVSYCKNDASSLFTRRTVVFIGGDKDHLNSAIERSRIMASALIVADISTANVNYRFIAANCGKLLCHLILIVMPL